MKRWEFALRRQIHRLRTVQGYLFAQDYVTVINPALKEKLEEVIGSKWHRATSLHGIGSALFFRAVFPIANSVEEQARYVSLMTGSEHDSIDVGKATNEIADLKSALEEYRLTVEKLLSAEEIVAFSSRARDQTKLPSGPDEPAW